MHLAATQLTFQVKIVIEVNSVANPLNLNPDSTSNPPGYVEGPVEGPH